MYSSVKALLNKLEQKPAEQIRYSKDDTKIAASVLLYRVIQVDGRIKPEEVCRLDDILADYFDVTEDELELFKKTIRDQSSESGSLTELTSVLKSSPNAEKLKIVDFMRQLSLSDNELHEFELNLVERVTELLEIE